MPLVIDATVGGASSNSFVTLAEAQAYMDSRLNVDAWTAASTDSQNRALAEATRELSSKMWVGTKAAPTQALAWPRWYATDPDISWAGNPYYLSNIIPQRVKDGTSELAFQFVNGGTTEISELDATLNVKRKRVDVLETEYFEPQQRARGLSRFPSVMRFVAPLLVGYGVTTPTVRG